MMISLQNSKSRSIIQVLIVFLFKIRAENSNKMIASIVQLRDEHVISDYSHSIINTNKMAKKLFNLYENLFFICDGTYARH